MEPDSKDAMDVSPAKRRKYLVALKENAENLQPVFQELKSRPEFQEMKINGNVTPRSKARIQRRLPTPMPKELTDVKAKIANGHSLSSPRKRVVTRAFTRALSKTFSLQNLFPETSRSDQLVDFISFHDNNALAKVRTSGSLLLSLKSS